MSSASTCWQLNSLVLARSGVSGRGISSDRPVCCEVSFGNHRESSSNHVAASHSKTASGIESNTVWLEDDFTTLILVARPEAVDNGHTSNVQRRRVTERYRGMFEVDRLPDEFARRESAIGYHPEHFWVLECLHAVAPDYFEFSRDHEFHRKPWLVVVAGHQTNLHMPAALSQIGDRVEAGNRTAEGCLLYTSDAADE